MSYDKGIGLGMRLGMGGKISAQFLIRIQNGCIELGYIADYLFELQNGCVEVGYELTTD